MFFFIEEKRTFSLIFVY